MTVEAHSPAGAMPASSATRAGVTPARLAREVIQSFLDQRWEHLETLIHPDAKLETGFAAPGARFGRKEVLDAGWVAAQTGAYQPVYELAESLDESTALVAVRLRYLIGKDLFSERDAAYLMTFEGGLLLRTRVFDSADHALAAHQAEVLGDRAG